MSNTLVSLNLKFVNQSDLQNDVQEHRKMISQSEAARDHLQLKTREFAAAHDAQSKAYQRRQEELIEENDGLRNEIQRQREEAARVQKAHLL